jgi:hypothetical protein
MSSKVVEIPHFNFASIASQHVWLLSPSGSTQLRSEDSVRLLYNMSVCCSLCNPCQKGKWLQSQRAISTRVFYSRFRARDRALIATNLSWGAILHQFNTITRPSADRRHRAHEKAKTREWRRPFRQPFCWPECTLLCESHLWPTKVWKYMFVHLCMDLWS